MMSRQMITVVLFLVAMTSCKADENATETDVQCLNDLINWCHNLSANDGVSQLLARSHFMNSSVEIACIWDDNGENCTKNGDDWFSCSVGGTLVYNGTLVNNGTLVSNATSSSNGSSISNGTLVNSGTEINQVSTNVVDDDACLASNTALYGLGPDTSAMVIHNVIHSFFVAELLELAIEELNELEYYENILFL